MQAPVQNLQTRPSLPSRTIVVHCSSSFSFANSERAAKPTGRRNRVLEKRQEQGLRNVAHGLCSFNAKQLKAVSHLLTEEHLREIRICIDIPKTNQGHKRQAGLVMKLLRADLDDVTLSKLAEAVTQAAEYKQQYRDRDVEQQLEVWMEGLLAGDEAVQEEVRQLLQDNQQDWQQVRLWVRTLQQHQQELEQQQEQVQQLQDDQQLPGSDWPALAASQGAPTGQAAVPVTDPEVLQLMQQLSSQQQMTQQQLPGDRGKVKGKGGSGGSKGSKSPATAARRGLRNMLKPHAIAMHAL